MALNLKKKILFLILATCIAFSVVFTVPQTAAILDHDCTNEDCHHCRQIEAAKYFIKIIKLAIIGLFFAVFLTFPAQINKKYAGSADYILSPVTLKVRFNS
jgi:hypothetical protein